MTTKEYILIEKAKQNALLKSFMALKLQVRQLEGIIKKIKEGKNG